MEMINWPISLAEINSCLDSSFDESTGRSHGSDNVQSTRQIGSDCRSKGTASTMGILRHYEFGLKEGHACAIKQHINDSACIVGAPWLYMIPRQRQMASLQQYKFWTEPLELFRKAYDILKGLRIPYLR